MDDAELKALFPAGLKGFIFDCDGVMIDSIEANREFYTIILKSLGLPPMTPEQEEFAFMATAKQALLNVLPAKFHDHVEEIIKNNINYDQQVLPKIKLMPGFRDFIKKAQAAGLQQAIDTNRTDFGIERVLQFFSIAEYFNPVISSSHTLPKPSPEGVQKICAAWHVQPVQTLFIGDSLDDGKAAKSAGAIFAAFGEKPLAGDIKVKNFRELEEMIFPFLQSSVK